MFKKMLLASLIGGLFVALTGCLPTTKLPRISIGPDAAAPAVPASSTPAQK